ncbi:MAG: biotin-dependent carboxyltransferase family protein [Pseudomonadota bacterium]
MTTALPANTHSADTPSQNTHPGNTHSGNTPAFKLRRAGMMTTLQDMGRIGNQHRGMTAAGAMDTLAFRIANALVGNPVDTGALEVGFLGPEFSVEATSARIAIGGNVQVLLTPVATPDVKKPLKPWQSHTVSKGDVISIGSVTETAFCYLAVAGGFDVPDLMGSQSTYTRAGIGGFEGRTLADGDVIALNQDTAPQTSDLMAETPPVYGSGPIRVVLGPQDDYFTKDAIQTFLSEPFPISQEADRMGQRLEGPKLQHADGFDIPSDGIAKGSIQVPGTGHPILLLSDHQTVGGYPKIATIISADIPRASQMRPGMIYQFTSVTVAEAEAARRAQEDALTKLISGLKPALPDGGIDLDALQEANLISGAVDALS